MNKLYILGALFVVILMGITWQMAGSNIGENDYMGLLAVVGAGAIATIAVVVVIKYVRQMQVDTATGQLADENWDGIGEYKNELPFGWALIFFVLTIWAIWYFIWGYPVNSYSQIGEYNEEVATYNEQFEAKHANLSDAEKVEMGKSLFLVQCAPCHGVTADGMNGKAANLNKRIAKESVIHVVKNGGNNFKTDFPGGMPPMMLTDEAQINAVAEYVAAGFPEGDTAGAEAFVMGGCTGCHGEKGEGMAYVGPRINGWDPVMVAEVLMDGKKGAIGVMPSFKNLLPVQVEAVGAYLSQEH